MSRVSRRSFIEKAGVTLPVGSLSQASSMGTWSGADWIIVLKKKTQGPKVIINGACLLFVEGETGEAVGI
jgi:hypothetical protein